MMQSEKNSFLDDAPRKMLNPAGKKSFSSNDRFSPIEGINECPSAYG